MLDDEDLTPWSLDERLIVSTHDHWFLIDDWTPPVESNWDRNVRFPPDVLKAIACFQLVAGNNITDRWYCTLRKNHKGPCMCNLPGSLKVVESGYVL